MKYLLDTNAWIQYVKDPLSPIRARLSFRQPREIVTCSVIKAELLHGAEKYGRPIERRAVINNLLSPFQSLPFDDGSSAIYARIRHELELTGQVIGPMDLQIASIALQHGCTLVTHNVREFSRVQGLTIEDWLVA